MSERLSIAVDSRHVDAVSGLLEVPARTARGSAILLAHGAGAGMESGFMAEAAAGLAARGFPVLRFNYVYTERMAREGKRKPPDRAPVLEDTHARALTALRERFPDVRTLLAGKSMGGRIGSHLAAKDHPCAGLVFFGYPLHPPGKPEKLRSEHFAAIPQPALFLQGSRDAFGRPDELRTALRTYGGTATISEVDDADHGFHVRKSSGRTDAEVLDDLLDRVAEWEEQTFP